MAKRKDSGRKRDRTSPFVRSGPTYTCEEERSPCTEDNMEIGLDYFAHDNAHMFVQCMDWGECFELECPSGMIWDDAEITCS